VATTKRSILLEVCLFVCRLYNDWNVCTISIEWLMNWKGFGRQRSWLGMHGFFLENKH
jgi:hypothetical protein